MSTLIIPDGLLSIGGVAVLGVGAVLHIVGLATTEWSVLHFDQITVKIGLWKFCQPEECQGVISFLESSKGPPEAGDELRQLWKPVISAIKASEAFAVLGMLASFVALTVAAGRIAMPMLGMSTKYAFPSIPWAASMTSLVFILVAVIVWALRVHTRLSCGDGLKTSIGYSFILCLVAGILINIGGVLGVLDRKA